MDLKVIERSMAITKKRLDQFKSKLFIVGVVAVLLLYVLSAVNDDKKEVRLPITIDNSQYAVESFDGPAVLVGKWMGSTSYCLKDYQLETTQVFSLGRGYIQSSGKPTKQALTQALIDEDDVPKEIKNYLSASCKSIAIDEDNVWFNLTLKRATGDKVYYWYGEDTDYLPEGASGVLFGLFDDGVIAFEKFDLEKIKPLVVVL